MASTVLSSKVEVKVYDSVYHTIDWTTRSIISQSSSSTELFKINRLTGGKTVVCMLFPYQQLLLFTMTLYWLSLINLCVASPCCMLGERNVLSSFDHLLIHPPVCTCYYSLLFVTLIIYMLERAASRFEMIQRLPVFAEYSSYTITYSKNTKLQIDEMHDTIERQHTTSQDRHGLSKHEHRWIKSTIPCTSDVRVIVSIHR